MKKIFSLIAALGFLSAPGAFAMVGGPWDGGDYSQALDSSGIYQAAMRFSNGSGMQQWGTNVSLTPTVTTTGAGAGASAASALKLGSYLDRSVVYHKGIVYVGNASGMVDHDRGVISGFTNGYTSLSASSTAQNGSGNQAVTASSVVVDNGQVSATCNSYFEGNITDKSPTLKFNGHGELTVLNPTLNSTLSGSLYSALQQLISEIPAAALIPPVANSPENALNSVLDGITAISAGIGTPPILPAPDTTQLDTTPMYVFGSRIFFLSSR